MIYYCRYNLYVYDLLCRYNLYVYVILLQISSLCLKLCTKLLLSLPKEEFNRCCDEVVVAVQSLTLTAVSQTHLSALKVSYCCTLMYIVISLLYSDVYCYISVVLRCILLYLCCTQMYIVISLLYSDVYCYICVVLTCILLYLCCTHMYIVISLSYSLLYSDVYCCISVVLTSILLYLCCTHMYIVISLLYMLSSTTYKTVAIHTFFLSLVHCSDGGGIYHAILFW